MAARPTKKHLPGSVTLRRRVCPPWLMVEQPFTSVGWLLLVVVGSEDEGQHILRSGIVLVGSQWHNKENSIIGSRF